MRYPLLKTLIEQLRRIYHHYHTHHGPTCRCDFSELNIRAYPFKYKNNYRWFSPVKGVGLTNGERLMRSISDFITPLI